MNELTKTKIEYALALLVALYTLQPLFNVVGGFGFVIFNFTINIKLIYFIFLASLGIVVYLYGLSLISDKIMFLILPLAHFFYGCTLFVPLVIVPTFFIVKVMDELLPIINALKYKDIIFNVLGIIAGVVIALLSSRFEERARKKDKIFFLAELLREKELRYKIGIDLIGKNEFNLAIMELAKSLELSLRRLLLFKNVYIHFASIKFMALVCRKMKLLSRETEENVAEINGLRNLAAHSILPMNKEQANNALLLTKKILKSIDEGISKTDSAEKVMIIEGDLAYRETL